MSAKLDELRGAVISRASGHCEYCGLPDQFQVGGFHVDHVVPRTCGGASLLDNLAYACPLCNARKWAHQDGFDGVTQSNVALFHPRQASLGRALSLVGHA